MIRQRCSRCRQLCHNVRRCGEPSTFIYQRLPPVVATYPANFNIEEDRREEFLALSELTLNRKCL